MNQSNQPIPSLEARPERRLIRLSGGHRHVDFVVTAPPAPADASDRRPSLRLALVLDRSGSMAGEKMVTARQAAIAVVERLDERDRCAVVVFDDHVDLLHEAAPVTPEVRQRLRAELTRVEARGSTALHEGWLTGARAVATDRPDEALSRVFLLTDGQANQGETDRERIASEAHGLRANAGIGTSTFGIGADYNEALLGPMAVAGGGQLHNLRSPSEITRTFVGELGELFAVTARNVVLEVEADPGVTVDVVGAYRTTARDRHVAMGLGDLIAGEARHVVVRFGFPPSRSDARLGVTVRLTVAGEPAGEERVDFTYAEHTVCDAEPRDAAATRQVARQHADRAQREAAQLNTRGDFHGARAALERVARRVAEYAGDDPELRAIVAELRAFGVVAAAPMAAAAVKEAYAGALRSSRGQRDLRGPS